MLLPQDLPAIFPISKAVDLKILPLCKRRWYELAQTEDFCFRCGRKIMIVKAKLELWIEQQIVQKNQIT
ncbi:MAG: hypothetical protein WC483_04500 [Candidatus Paceibacterota bacterium]|jgi:hypothetical protein